MVRIEEGKITIEIETTTPLNDLSGYQKGLIDVLRNYAEQTNDPVTSYYLGDLLSNLMPPWEELNKLYPKAKS